MGFEIERFITPVNDGLLCSICRDVLENPLQAPCEHAFCSTCIHAWLVHDAICPEDRQPLQFSQLKSLYRYMRNDLNKLPMKCINQAHGCTAIVLMEKLEQHQNECGFARVECPSAGCRAEVERRYLDAHLITCEFRKKVCPRGCGMVMLSSEDEDHNCIAELRTEVELLRSEMICKLEDQRHEMQLRLDSQRSHMVQKTSAMQQQVDELKGQMSRVQQEVRSLVNAERKRSQEMERMELEKKEILELLKSLQQDPGASKKTSSCRMCRRKEKTAATSTTI